MGRQVLGCGLPVLSDIDLFFASVREPVHAVTGTNGKSTVTSLVGHLLAGAGARPGVAATSASRRWMRSAPTGDCYVLELSSFQLERTRTAPLKAATILNVSGDHLDWHGSMDCYAAAKQRIYADAERAVANRSDGLTYPQSRSPDELITFGGDEPEPGHWGIRVRRGQRSLACGGRTLLETSRLPLAGRHNEQNVLAALAMVHGGDFRGDGSALEAAVAGFSGLAHRCETVASLGAVTYVNDSKATNVGAALAALSGLGEPPGSVVLIAGGDGKSADFAQLGDAIAKCARHLVVLGADGPAIERAVRERVPVSRARDMGEGGAAGRCRRAAGRYGTALPGLRQFRHVRELRGRGAQPFATRWRSWAHEPDGANSTPGAQARVPFPVGVEATIVNSAVDRPLLFAWLFVLAFGLVMVASASVAMDRDFLPRHGRLPRGGPRGVPGHAGDTACGLATLPATGVDCGSRALRGGARAGPGTIRQRRNALD